MSESDSFGASLTTIEKVKLLVEWSPFLGLLEQIAAASGNQAKALALVEALRWLAARTSATTDDKALDHLEAMLKTPEGAAIVQFLVTLAGALK